ncbi:hypothetical protein L596_020481 [Steinernema carpocapsae]|uniref:Uncharacterized protein n=1 Tax=Steinernema carpocapsae TaxID=34508 RepID=A0A4U5MTN8_STECR|nr:hypothetical protein L596_020481 [Steinernema carpocapsae]
MTSCECPKFAGKVVIVTGSSSGIGQGIAVLLGQQGASVTIHGRSVEGLEKTKRLLLESGVNEDKILLVQGAVEKPETADKLINKTLEKYGHIDVLVNNAGIGHKVGTEPESEENFQFVVDVNLKSVIRLDKLVIPHLEKTKGCIVNVSSIMAMKPFAFDRYYAMTKASLDHYMRYMAAELGRKGIRINNINPGLIETNFFSRIGRFNEHPTFFEDFAKRDVPLGRAGTGADIAKAVSYLASDDASYVTGTTLVVDGGTLLGNHG